MSVYLSIPYQSQIHSTLGLDKAELNSDSTGLMGQGPEKGDIFRWDPWNWTEGGSRVFGVVRANKIGAAEYSMVPYTLYLCISSMYALCTVTP
jgi:hypothetical protein